MTDKKLVAKHLPLAELLTAAEALRGWMATPPEPGEDKRELYYMLRAMVHEAARKFVDAEAADAAALAAEILHFSSPERVQ